MFVDTESVGDEDGDCYTIAQSKNEYDRLLAEKIAEFQKILEEQREEMEMQSQADLLENLEML